MVTADPCDSLRGGEIFVFFCSFLFPINCLFKLLNYCSDQFNPAILAISMWCQNIEGVGTSVDMGNSIYCGFS